MAARNIRPDAPSDRHPWLILGCTVLVLAVSLWWALGPAADPEAPYGAALVITARIAAVLFLLAFLASTLARLTPTARRLLRNRRYVGLSFALVHGTHGCLILAWSRMPDVQVDLTTIVGGGLAYALIFLMALTSNDASVRLLGRWWRRLHRVGNYYVWLIFTITFLGNGVTASLSSLFFALMVGALLLRLSGPLLRRRTASAA